MYLTLSLLLLILLLVTALRPTTVTIAKLISDIQKEKDLNTRLDNKIAQIQKAQEAYADRRVAPRIGLLDTGLPADPRFGSLAESLQNMISGDGLTLVSMNIGDIKIKPQPKQETSDAASMGVVQFDIAAKGSYESLKKFVQRLENWRRLVDIRKININKPVKTAAVGASGEMLEANISGVAGYIYNEEKQN